MLPNILNL